jgi:hypothetical protein
MPTLANSHTGSTVSFVIMMIDALAPSFHFCPRAVGGADLSTHSVTMPSHYVTMVASAGERVSGTHGFGANCDCFTAVAVADP